MILQGINFKIKLLSLHFNAVFQASAIIAKTCFYAIIYLTIL